jgi:ABC-type bacteriocin/lantibiotic exporter with double-glycine peptidase domain
MRIPFFKQRTNEYCGPAVMQMTLHAYGMRATQKALALEAGTNKARGTTLVGLVRALRKRGLQVEAAHNRSVRQLRAALRAKKIVIVCYTERAWNWGHYSIVRSFRGKYIILQDPAEHGGKPAPFTIEDFEKRWRDSKFTRSVRWAAFVGK